MRTGRLRALVTALVLLSGSGAAGCGDGQAAQSNCPGLDETGSGEFSLSVVEGECIGWTNERHYAFSPEVDNVVSRITAQNKAVRQRWERPDKGQPAIGYVKVAVLMPMTAADGSAMPADTIPRALMGVLVAQSRANDLSRADFRPANTLGVQVVLANEGRTEKHWKRVVDQLAGMTDDEQPLVAVVGLGSSIPETLAGAKALGGKHIAGVGAVLASTDMVTSHEDNTLFKVSPSNRDFATAIGGHFDPLPASGLLVQDSNDDNYVRTLGQALTDRFGERYGFDQRTRWFAGSRQPVVATPRVFGPVADAVCEYDTVVVFFAGRERDLPELITAMAGHRCREDKPRFIATGTTGLGRTQADPKVLANLEKANLKIVDASSVNVVAWSSPGQPNPVPAHFEAFHSYYLGMGLAEEELVDGYVVGNHDALAVAVFAARQAAENLGAAPSAGDVLQQLKNLRDTNNPVPAAGGDLTFGADGWPVGRFVPIVLVPEEPVDGASHVTGAE